MPTTSTSSARSSEPCDVRAIILAAGEGTRLRPYTLDRPKCLVPLAGRPLLEWQLDALHAAGIDDITVVTGYRADQIRARGCATVHNADFATTNMVASLMCADALLDGSDDVVVCYGDLAYEPRLVRALSESSGPVAITVDREWRRLWELRMPDPLADAETLRLDAAGNVVELGRKPTSYADIQGQYMGLIGIRRAIAPKLVDVYRSLDTGPHYEGRDRANMYMTSFLQYLIDDVTPVAAVVVDGGWLEVDTIADLETYEALYAQGRLRDYCALGPG
jgi:L-glutamine-phosphate cytidylyltransferase